MSLPSLAEQLQAIIERTYRLETGIRDLGSYLIGDRGLHRIYGRNPSSEDGPRLLLRFDGDATRARVYVPDRLVAHLERHHPLRAIHRHNVDALAGLVEELDHLLLVAHRALRGQSTSLLDLELQANVTKALVVRQLVARHQGRPLEPPEEAWVRWHLLEKGVFVEDADEDRRRYEEARRLALKVLRHLETLEGVERLRWLRRFARTEAPRRVREADRLAA